MRNPIEATPDRPVPLPDCILRDAWWLAEAPRMPPRAGEHRRTLSIVRHDRSEGQIDRDRQQDD